MKKLKHDFAELKASLFDKKAQLQNANEQNTMLKMELERTKANDEAVSLAETAEQDALIKLGHITEEADRSRRKATRVTEQLHAANSEMEAELRRLKVQSDQWRKAAEAAAAMLSTGNNGKIVEQTGSLDNSYNNTIGGTLGSPYSEDMNDESPKKNMLNKIGVSWKKGQK